MNASQASVCPEMTSPSERRHASMSVEPLLATLSKYESQSRLLLSLKQLPKNGTDKQSPADSPNDLPFGSVWQPEIAAQRVPHR